MSAVEHSVNSQRLVALERGNEVRLARSALRRRIGCGELSAVAVVADPPAEAAGMLVGRVLRAQPYWGPTRSLKLLRLVGISDSKPLGELTPRQRQVLADALGDGKR